MKKIILTLLVLSLSIIAYSQNENPFAKFGYDVLVATSSKGEFAEFHDQTDVVEIGSVLYNTQTNKIVKVLDKDETTIDISSATAAMSIDPMCEKYYWISPYAYVMNNPLKFVDPDGRDLYILNSDGTTTLALRTDHNYDRLFAFDSGQTLRVNDQSILPNFAGGDFSYAETSNADDAFNLFKFAADNSNVEWGLDGYKGGNFLLRTSYTEGEVGNTSGSNNPLDMEFHMHSHPLTTEVGASGFDAGPPGAQGYPQLSGDVRNADNRFVKFQDAGKTSPNQYPNHFVYTVDTKTLYHYMNTNPANRTFSNITSPSILKNHVSKKNYNRW